MSMRDSGARYNFGLSRLRIRARNDDQTLVTLANMIGGAGPFDFSAESAPTAVPFFFKLDAGAVIEGDIDISAAADDAAVTVDEWVTAMAAGITAATGITGLVASKAATTGRAKLVKTGGAYAQIWGPAVELAKFGQGKGLKAVCSDTAQTINFAPTIKEDTTSAVTDANMKDTEVIVEGYKKGWTGNLVDTVEDFEMMELVESGTIDSLGAYHEPNSATKKVTFELETWNPVYQRGTNLEDEMVGWEHIHALSVKGSVGEDALANGARVKNYALIGVNYKALDGSIDGARIIKHLALTAWSPELFDSYVAVEPA